MSYAHAHSQNRDLSDDPVPIIGICQHVHTYSETLIIIVLYHSIHYTPLSNFVKLPCLNNNDHFSCSHSHTMINQCIPGKTVSYEVSYP